MSDKNITIHPEADQLTIREGRALPLREPRPIRLTGTLGSAYTYLSHKLDKIDILESHVKVSFSLGCIQIVVDEDDYYERSITGQLKNSEELGIFKVNTDHEYTPNDLANRVRLFRSYFADSSQAMSLVTELKAFKAKINTELEKSSNDQGSAKNLRDQVVDHNIPDSFTLYTRVYEGQPKIPYLVHIIVDPYRLNITLESPELREKMEEMKEELMNEEIESIKALGPNLAIFYL